jgi:ADP-ribosyl-[dinitrogen reductase] hydrolase
MQQRTDMTKNRIVGVEDGDRRRPLLSNQQRFRGALLGLAAGDALGTTVEFEAPGTFEPLRDMVGGGPFGLKPGEWTDDTSMALCLAASLLEKEGFDPVDQLERYHRWWRTGYLSSNGRCFDIGNTVREALENFQTTRAAYCGSADPATAGNGSLMRLAPVPLFFSDKPEEAIERSGESSRTTHQAATAVDACRYFGGLLCGALQGKSKAALLAPRYSPIAGCFDSHPLDPEIEEVASGSFVRRDPPVIRGTGFVVRSLEAALWAFHRSDSFEEGCLMAANLGDDADTTAAIYGQLAGAYYGESGIPTDWRRKLAELSLIENFADRLLAAAGAPRVSIPKHARDIA